MKKHKNMAKKTIKLNEAQLRNMVAESVKKTLNEIGDTSKGQKALGALAQRQAMDDDNYDVRNPKCPAVKTYKHAEKARGGDSYDNQGKNKNPLYKDYAKGSVEYMNAHTNDLAKSNMKKRMTESQINKIVAESVKKVLKEWGNPYDDGQFMYQYIDADRGDKAAEYGLGYNPAHNRASKALDYNERSGIHRKDKEVVDIMKFLWPKCSSLMLNHDPNKVIVALKNIIKEFQGMAGNA